MHNVWLIAKREYLEQVRGKAFKITTILIPGIFLGIFSIVYLAGKNSGTGKHVAVASSDTVLAHRVQQQLLSDKDARMSVDVVAPASDQDRQHLTESVDRKELDGFLWLEAAAGQMPLSATYESRTSGDFTTVTRLTDAVTRAAMQQQLTARGIPAGEIESLTKDVKVTTLQVQNGKTSSSNAAGTFWAAYIMAFLLSFTVVMYGMNVGRSVIQEKTSRIFEVMLASVRPEEMLAGKLIGIGSVGITQIAIWIVAAGLFAGSAIAGRLMSGEMSIHVAPVEIVLFGVYFVLGYVLYSALFAGLAATVSTEQELQQYSPLAAVPIWLSFGMISFIVSNPNSIWSVAISMFPPCAPITMFLRMASQFPPWWQIAASILLMLMTIVLVLWVASRVYRVGILMYGKRATLPEMIRWLRYS
ncbi:putative ABC transporter permease [Acidisarcina polymorpha]|uniref:Putative ABC transporter permease n=1 Tax=Acidisarcina polymorpha TaxID=2211140 RepID=A0A2Z5FX59_9BACT|nr:ABC transporter permease [Acidisarcina polymorpha]AXC11077.1 putative ABC transporter permease [Acidisarcina polymorpha]